MWLLMLEAGAALVLLLFIVWWTMYSGRGHDRSTEDTRDKNDTR
ncbi:hypothetical protein [Massilia terrae]|uniref:CcoQ/FixQ family Cbb3-type cytochrome c oxidase assembly chaperone n=1 Tax=Massilia terrae TaxID=1811224 RepID=A0ABT2D4A0_9BURK|nr:hypothetical protein [Massilia terrae]MCS0661074.1 hypothetical protein [Massilia terrae]